MQWFFIFWLFPFLMHGQAIDSNHPDQPLSLELDIAPLIPLEPQFPLGFTKINRQLLIEDPERLKKIKHSLQQDLDKHAFPWLTIITLLGCGGIGWVIYLMRDRWPKRSVKAITPLPSQQQTDQALQALNKHFPEPNEIPDYYAKLASIILQALQARLEWKIAGLTTPEIAQVLKNQSNLSFQQIAETLSILTEIDQVKFAGKKPSREETTQIFQQVKNFILNNSSKKT